MTTMKLQKLCYYSQGWSLAWDGKPIFEEEIQAWANGPVVYELFDAHRGQFTVGAGAIPGRSSELSQDERETIDAVLDGYGNFTGQQLSELTHSERPWREARSDLDPGDRSSRPIELESLQDFFGGLSTVGA